MRPFSTTRFAVLIRSTLMVAALLGAVVIGGGSFLLTDGGMRLALSQAGFGIGPNATVLEKLFASGQPPTISNGTLTNGSTNFRGSFTATSAGSAVVVTFTNQQSPAFATAPICFVADNTIGSSGGGVVTTSTTALTVNQVVAAHVYTYVCIGIN